MARLNIEDSLWKDDRFQDLMIRVGNRHTAKGMMLELWSMAQEFWFPERKPIPMERIQRSGLEVVLETGLAEVVEGGVLAAGTETAFEWLFERQEAGRKGGLAKASKGKRSQAKPTQAKQTVASSSFSSSSSFSNSISNKSPLPPKGLQAVWNENCGRLPKAETLSRDRERQAKARLAEQGDPAYWERIVKAIAANPFCLGDNDRGWVATFDYLLRPKTHVSISEKLNAGVSRTTSNHELVAAMEAYELEKAALQAQADAECGGGP